MATDVDRSCYGWSREDLDDQDDSREISISQMLDHGSISFGRFALEPLSWEKRSVFTHNRYQEELEKCKAPGLVAQKKAYFEEYYKRIRTMKTLQENQHTEPESYCGHNNGVSEKIREDERVVPSKSNVEEMIKTVGPDVEKATTEVSLDVDGETALVKLDSHAYLSKENKNGESPPNSKHWQILDINSYHHEPITTSIADSELHVFLRDENKLEPQGIISGSISQQIGVGSQRVIGKKSHGDELDYVICSDRENASIEVPLSIDVETALLETDPPVNSSEDVKMGENSQNSKQIQLLDQNSCDHEPITTSIEDCKQQDFISQANEVISMETENFVPNDSFYSSSSHKILEDKLNAEQKKEHSYAAGDFVNSELKSKSVTVMLTQILKDSSQKRNGKKNVCIVSHKQTVDRLLNSKYTTSVSHESNKKMHSKITTPRPFSFATGKQAVVSISASARHDAKNMPSSTSLPHKNTNSKAVSSKPGIPYSHKRGKLESSGHEPRRQPLVTSGQATHLKGASANNVIKPPKARSVNLPTSCKGGTNVGTNSHRYRRNNEDGKQKANDETCLKEVRAQGKSTIFSVISRNQNPDNVKMARSRIKDLLSVNTKNSQLGDNSLVGRKLRPEKPRWR